MVLINGQTGAPLAWVGTGSRPLGSALPAGAASALREYPHGDCLLLYTAMDAKATIYLLSIRHRRQLSLDFARLWPGANNKTQE